MENLSNVSELPTVSIEMGKILSELLEKRKKHKLTEQERLELYALHTLSMAQYGSMGIQPTHSEKKSH
jgi:hypothetical protein